MATVSDLEFAQAVAEDEANKDPSWLNSLVSGGTNLLADFLGDGNGGYDWRNLATVGGGIAGALGLFDGETPKVGYQGKIPRYKMIRDKVMYDDSERRPGSAGRRYLSRPRFATAENVPAAQAESAAEAQAFADAQKEGMARGGLASVQRFANGGMPQGMPQMPNMAKQMPNTLMGANPAARPQMGGQGTPPNRPTGIASAMRPKMMNPQMPQKPQGMNLPKPPQMGGNPPPMGGMPPMQAMQAMPPQGTGRMDPEDVLASLAATGKVQPMPQPAPQMQQGLGAIQPPMGFANGGYMGGATDGMADRIPAQIDGQQPAALSDGEFVIPADVVSHLGNGNSNAGANTLYNMMDRIRQARTGSAEQGRQINPNQFMPRG